jgi:hypothetical protein
MMMKSGLEKIILKFHDGFQSCCFPERLNWPGRLKALVVKNSVLHDFGFGKVSPAKQL